MRKCDIHTYELKDIGINKKYMVLACARPYCLHYIPPKLGIGKASACPRCHRQYYITRENMVRGYCDECLD